MADSEMRFLSLVELVQWRGEYESARVAYRFLADGEREESILTCGDLFRRARAIAARLQNLEAEGQRALLLYPAGADYVSAFFGCLLAGVIAVPAYPPRLNRNAARLALMADDAGAAIALTTTQHLSRLESNMARTPGFQSLRLLATETIADELSKLWRAPLLNEQSLAYLQYTSGSTAEPKGVMVTHANVLHNSAYIHRGFAHTPQSISLTWLPHFHDMGLLDGIIQPLYGGFTGLLMSPTAFLQRPARWLEAITRHKVTHSGGPNFAYDLCVRRISAEVRETLDLKSWSLAYNGAEPVREETLRSFAETFAACGFRPGAFYPAYGLAEATLKVSGGNRGEGAITCTVKTDAMEKNLVVEASTDDEHARTLVSSGQATFETEVLIVNPETLAQCEPNEVGEIWASGPGVAAGYWNRPEETGRTFKARLSGSVGGTYLRTGDLGFVREGALYVTGRLKDLVIIRGRNLYPQDIEAAVERSHTSLRRGSGAAFSVESDGVEQLVIVQELEPRQQPDTKIFDAIRQTLAEEFEAQPVVILLVEAGRVPKTSSGKVQRNLCRKQFLRHEFAAVAAWQANSSLETEFIAQGNALEPVSAQEIEKWLQSQLAGALRVEAAEIDVSQPFTHYGLDSLMAVGLMHSLEIALGISLPLADFLQSPSLAELASRAFDEFQANMSRTPRAPSSLPTETNRYRLSHNQRSLWFLAQIAPESAAYNVATAVRIKTETDVAALRRVFQTLVDRHPALRTTFDISEGEPAQQIHEGMEASFRLEDASALDDAALKTRLSEQAHLPFDLERGPLLRVVLFRQAREKHVLLIVAHHIIVDFWSLAVLMQELGELYRADTNGTAPVLAPLAANYTDYVGWQSELLQGEAGERLETFWRQELAGATPILDLHTDRPRPPVQTYRGASEPLRLDAELTRQLKNLSRTHNATLYTLLLAAFQVLLHRYTGQEDLSVGSPTNGRSAAGFARTVGYFVNPVVIRSHPSGASSFVEFLSRVRKTVLDAFAHQEYPFDLLVTRLQPERDPGRSPLFQVMFALNQAHLLKDEGLAAFALGEEGAQMELGGLRLESVRLEQRVAQFDLALTVAEADDALAASLEYNSDLFEPATIKRMLAHFRTLLESIARDPAQPLARLNILTKGERRQLLDEWNDPQQLSESNTSQPRELARVIPVHQLFEQQAERVPDAPAAVFENTRLSYRELNERANQLAHYLRSCGVATDVPVAICLERSVEIPVALLGVLKAGGAYVPLDPSYPRERLANMLEDAQSPVLLTQQSLVERLAAGKARVICLDADWKKIEQESLENPAASALAEQLAYIIYTSGSTGKPKGVMVSHGSLANAYQAWRLAYQLDSVRSILQMASVSFDVFTEDVWRALCSGAKLVLCPKEFLLAPDELYELMLREEIDFADFVPAVLRALAEQLEQTGRSLEFMRVLVSGADTLYVEDYRKIHRLCGSRTRLMNSYGVTEATIDNTSFENTAVKNAAAALPSDGIVPIGRPFANLRIYLLNEWLEPVPVGVVGELYIGGDCLARGYLNRPALTAEKFIPDPFGRTAGARLYMTGDLARYRPDGNIEFLGRNDYQVKVRGLRVELGEIEATLLQHARVRKAVVIAAGEGRNHRRLVAYVVSRQGSAPGAHELRNFLKERVPEQMLPTAFIFLDELPLTPNGKVDRRALPEPEQPRLEPEQGFVAPQTATEKALCDIWAALLKLESVGVRDNFFESGGDSILSIQVIARAGRLGINLTPGQIFEHPTIAQLAAVATLSTGSRLIAEQGRVTGTVKLTPIQRWFFEQDFAAPGHWNMALMLETKERLDPALLEKTLEHLLEHHDALRHRFVKEEVCWRQSVGAESEAKRSLSVVDLSGLPLTERRAVRERIAGEIQSRFKLDEGTLARVALFDSGERPAQHLLFVIHHLVVDAVSWGILLEDFERIYAQLRDGQSVELPLKTTSFKYWAEELELFAQSDALREELPHWTELSSQEIEKLPAEVAAKNIEGASRTHTVTLAAAETRALLQEVGEAYHTQINDLLLTALVKAFQSLTRKETLLVELEGHGREELFAGVDLSRTVGWFTSAFPVLLDLDGAEGSGAAIQTIKEQLRKISRHGIGYGLLRYVCADMSVVERMRALPQAEVSFNYLGQLDRLWQDSALFVPAQESVGATRHAQAGRSHLIEINAAIVNQELKIDWTFNREIHEVEAIEKLAGDYVASLRELIAHCLEAGAGGYTPSDFPLARLSQQQLNALFKETADITDVYRLSPMQQGMLFHSLYAPGTGIYTGQFSCLLEGELDAQAFIAAWRQTLARHEILRASFVWENLDEPLQLIHRSVNVPLEQLDWRESKSDEAAQRWESLLKEEQQRDFNLSVAPLMRFVLARVAEDACRFVWTHHHLLLDGWSGALLLREVFAAYDALKQDAPLRVERVRSYRDYISWLGQQNMAQAEAFWRENLRGFTAPTPLAIDRASGGTDGVGVGALGERKLRLDQDLTARLQAFARGHQLTLNTLVQGAWALLLYHYSRERDVVFGVTVAGRPASLAGVESMTGLFINTLPVRVSVPPRMRLLEWLKRLQTGQVQLREYEYSPLLEVQRWSEAPRDAALFESLFVFENYPLDADAVTENFSLNLTEVRSFDRTNYPLTIVALPGRELVLQSLYDSQRFDDEAIERLLSHLETLLGNFMLQPQQYADTVEFLTGRERHQLLVEWNQAADNYPQPQLPIHELFEAQAAETPEAVALVCGDERLTYDELNTRANRLAHHLQSMGVGVESLVGILLHRHTQMLVSLLAVLKAGGAYLPLDTLYPQERLAFMLDDAGASVLLTESSLLERVPLHGARLLLMDADAGQFSSASTRNSESHARAENLAYVTYTSGSTGKPKGVCVTHSNVIARVCRSDYAHLDTQTRLLQLAPLAFDASTFEVWASLLNGGCLVQAAEQVPQAAQLKELIERERVTTLFLTTSLFNALVDEDVTALGGIKEVLSGGEASSVRRFRRVLEELPEVAISNIYGPTETTTFACSYRVERLDENALSVPIGRGIARTQVYVLDERMQPSCIGVAGELYIGGAGLARGYRGRPELTAEKFVPHPFATSPGARLYRTGDLTRRLPDGELEFLGRLDHQVKIRGYRIELGEIETALAQHGEIQKAVVVAREDIAGDKRLVAYLVAQDGTSLAVEGLRAYLKSRLPEFMMPSAFLLLDELPLTANGKVDRKALPAPASTRLLEDETYVAPRNDVEEVLAGIWTELLGVERVGVFDNFFDLGGHSLLATRLLSSLRKIFRLELTLREVFEATTIAELAELLAAQEETMGQTAKIARVWKRIKNISSGELKHELERKRKEKSGI
jgi:amino acid adenylation domain-containing protein/non-ribosomal peptide synthase protein (TIGR01720 family)